MADSAVPRPPVDPKPGVQPLPRQTARSASPFDGPSGDSVVVEDDSAPSAQPHDVADANSAVRMSVEAFGSGVLLNAELEVAAPATVGDLRSRVLGSVALPPKTRTVRMFVGHGGVELDSDAMLVATSMLANDPSKPLVVFPLMCT